MPLSEFDLIKRYFSRNVAPRGDVVLGIGDDAALLAPPPRCEVVTALVTVNESAAFAPTADAAACGQGTLAAGLNRLAATGAEPAWATLSVTLPAIEQEWLQGFSDGMLAIARAYGVQVIGGDTSHGPGSLMLFAMGLVPDGSRIGLSGAQPGDLVFVTGRPGEAEFHRLAKEGALPMSEQENAKARQRRKPRVPRVGVGLCLRGVASAACDISDGLVPGLNRVLRAGKVGATLYAERLPVASWWRSKLHLVGGRSALRAAGGELELCFAVPPSKRRELEARCSGLDIEYGWIGTIDRAPGLRWVEGEPSITHTE